MVRTIQEIMAARPGRIIEAKPRTCRARDISKCKEVFMEKEGNCLWCGSKSLGNYCKDYVDERNKKRYYYQKGRMISVPLENTRDIRRLNKTAKPIPICSLDFKNMVNISWKFLKQHEGMPEYEKELQEWFPQQEERAEAIKIISRIRKE